MPRKYVDKHTRAAWRLTSAKRYAENKQRVDAYKAASRCKDCGFGPGSTNYHVSALEFDHLPGTNKNWNISVMMTYSWTRIVEEMAKCDVVCANCHRYRTNKRHEDRTVVMMGRSRLEDDHKRQPQLFHA